MWGWGWGWSIASIWLSTKKKLSYDSRKGGKGSKHMELAIAIMALKLIFFFLVFCLIEAGFITRRPVTGQANMLDFKPCCIL